MWLTESTEEVDGNAFEGTMRRVLKEGRAAPPACTMTTMRGRACLSVDGTTMSAAAAMLRCNALFHLHREQCGHSQQAASAGCAHRCGQTGIKGGGCLAFGHTILSNHSGQARADLGCAGDASESKCMHSMLLAGYEPAASCLPREKT